MQKFYSPRTTFLLLLVFGVFIGSTSDVLGQCDPPEQLPTGLCYTAPLTCLQDACYSTQNNPPTGEPINWCGGNTQVHNPQYFLFQALSTSVQINIHVNSCVGGGCGLQSAIIDTCISSGQPWSVDNVVACDPGTPVGGTMFLSYNMMVVDSFYWLMIDGCGGQICEYTIEFVEGILNPGIPGELTGASTDDPVVCQGQDTWTATALPQLPEAHGYLWTGFPWGNETTTYHDMSGPNDPITIPDNATPGIYEICVVAFSGCDTTDNPVCFDLEIIAIDDGYAAPVTLCPEDFVGIVWQGININGPGIYMKTLNTPEGCPYDSIKEYLSYPMPQQGVVDVVECAETYTYEGVDYTAGGSYLLQYPNGSIYGCDSTAMLNLDLIYIEAEIDFYCDAQQFTLTSTINYAIPTSSGLTYEWYYNGDLWCQSAMCVSPYEGVFELFVSYTIDGVTCTYPAINNPLVITLADLVPEPPVLDQWSDVACALDFPTYSVVDDDLDIEFYTWTVMPSGVPLFPNGSNNAEIEVNWQGFTGGTICVTGTNDCGEGPPTCFDVTVIPSPIADFTMPATACVDSAVTITFTGTASQNATFLWNFGSGATIVSGGTGPGPHMISWGAPGTQTVTLQVAEMGCDTSDISFNITVEALGQPVLSCTSTLNSVTFEWEPVPGAGSYTVNVLQGPAGTIVDDTSYVVTGLAPGTVVEIQVVALGLGACAQQTATLQCVAQSCPPKMITIQLPSDSFCLGDVTGPIMLSALVEGSPGVGVWSGPGVDPTGTFDPVVAGVGQHQIVFMYMEGTCNYQRSRTVYVLDTPTANFTIDMAICQSGTAAVQYTGTASTNANYIWNFGAATVVSGTGDGPYTLRWNSPGMYSISLMVEENNCPSAVVTQMIDVQPTLTAPTIQCFPTTSSVAIQWGMVPNATAYDVTHLFGAMGVVNGNRYEVNGLMPGDSVAISITVSNSGLCPPVVVVASCVAQDCPTPTFVIDPVDDICLYSGTGTVDLNVTVTNGTGSGSWSGPGITDVNQGIFNPVTAGPGSHVISYDYNDMGCSFSETTTIDVYDVPTATISNTDLILTCDNGNQLVLDGTSSVAPGTITYLWTTSDGVFVGPTNQATATVGAPGTYDLLIVDTVSGCEDMASITVMKDDSAPTADAGPNGLLNCNIDFVVLGGNSSSGPGITYLWSTVGGVISSDPTASRVTVTSGGVYDLMVSDSNNGCVSSDQATVTVDTLYPTGVISVAEILDCDTEQTTVSATITPAGGMYSYAWSTTSGQILSGAGSATITVDRAAMYTLVVTNQVNGCSDTLTVSVLADDDVISDLQTMVDNPDCVGDVNGSVAISQVIGGNTPYTYAWSNGGTGTSIANLAPGTYMVTVSDVNGCKYTETFTLPAPQAINPDIGENIRVNVGETVTVTLTVTDSASIDDVIWAGVAPACAGCFTNAFTGEASGDILVTVIDTNGCQATATIRLFVFRPKNIFIPNVFSPNGDGVNDLFKVQGNTIQRILSLRIFDRWGGLVYEDYDFDPNGPQGWDGTFNGKDLNPGVYVYRAELLHDDERMTTEIIRGDITLVR